ncbi:MAG: SRPBCC domain-containing protein, partial [Pseudolysinimonas sp.]
VRRTIRIAAPVARVWAAVTEPALISQWFGRAEFAGDAPGARGTLTWADRDPIPVRIDAVDAPHSITYRWNNDDASDSVPAQFDELTATAFTFTLDAVGDETQLTVVETLFDRTSDAEANMGYHREGWTSELDKLVALVEA